MARVARQSARNNSSKSQIPKERKYSRKIGNDPNTQRSPISLHIPHVKPEASPLRNMRTHVFQNTEYVPHTSAIMLLQTQLESQPPPPLLPPRAFPQKGGCPIGVSPLICFDWPAGVVRWDAPKIACFFRRSGSY